MAIYTRNLDPCAFVTTADLAGDLCWLSTSRKKNKQDVYRELCNLVLQAQQEALRWGRISTFVETAAKRQAEEQSAKAGK